MPIDYSLYPPNWPQIRADILARDQGKCKHCGAHNYAVGYRLDGEFYDSFDDGDMDKRPSTAAEGSRWVRIFRDRYNYYGAKHIMIVLTVAHLDHDRDNNDYDNLAALCQRCHIVHDADQHAQSRKRNWTEAQSEAGQMSIFGGVDE